MLPKINQNLPPKINQILSPIFDLHHKFGGQKLHQFWGHEFGPLFDYNLCPRKCIEKCPPEYCCASRKKFSRSQIFESLELKS